MKRLLISFCEDCPFLDISTIEKNSNNIEIYECHCKDVGEDRKLISRSDEMYDLDPIFIPEWCPLEEHIIKKRCVEVE
jgi:hypothetical protein